MNSTLDWEEEESATLRDAGFVDEPDSASDAPAPDAEAYDADDARGYPPVTIREALRAEQHRLAALQSEPPPAAPWSESDRADFDERDTAERLPAVYDDACSTRRRLRAFRPRTLASAVTLDSSEVFRASDAPVTLPTSSPRPADADEVLQQIARLRRSMHLSAALSVLALGCCVLLALKLTVQPPRPATPPRLERGIAAAAPRFLPAPATASSAIERGVEVNTTEQQVPPAAVHQGEQSPALPAKIRVTLRLLSQGATVCIARHGEQARMLRGSFPMTLELEPGSYALFVARGSSTKSLPLLLSADETERDVALSLP